MMKKLMVGGVAAAVAVSTGSLAMAAGGGETQTSGGPGVHARTSGPAIACDGGAQKKVLNRISSTPFTFDETAATYLVPGAAAKVKGPKHGVDTLSITFSAEAQLSGSTAGDHLYDWMGLEVLVDGSPIKPYTASPDVLAITGGNTYDSQAAQFCTKVGPGKHLVEVRTNLHDGNGNDNLVGWLDDYTLRVEVSN